ncbi:DUF3499 domain-containing protein [Tsukamurella strandjordii]|uniref:DUF3499 domain-containing protein n=2 Tax=Tsukamurella strandjordii TaxID=147577 RepID=A0AA90S9K1_9ACTN|nr:MULTISPECIES: DUF3499 domain-containing protein [Tsukamurella]MDP0400280.1 DUF3499 domain-containing protein [Tsukamurella strandjordii]
MNSVRQCCRPGCRNLAVATLTFDYRQSIAVLGPLGTTSEPHAWDLCDFHAGRMTAPRGWEMLRNLPAYSVASVGGAALDDDLTALADTVREGAPRPVGDGPAGDTPVRSLPPIGAMRPVHDGLGGPQVTPSAQGSAGAPKHAARPGRRGHLRVLPDPVD